MQRGPATSSPSPRVACMAPPGREHENKGTQCGLCRALRMLCRGRDRRREIVEDKSEYGSCAGDGGGCGGPDCRNKGPPIECRLPCNLEDLYRGTTKKMKITRDVLGADGKTRTVEEILPVAIKPGSGKGTRITIPGKGHERRDLAPSDVVFVIEERPHEVYTREGDDLVAVEHITLVQALTGYTARLPTLDGGSIILPIGNVIHPNYEEVLEEQGMPIAGEEEQEPRRMGNLRIRFQIKFPRELTADQKTAIREITRSPSLTYR
ncbi:hypothetical protein Taro_017725 [Colocasia esculenta]|uniref:Chaperone DnaJ C-terminal domain-containing protein n=1 Tax=Colocasia esculenta TaxID=4460 RepID=A0A843V095_COLES|nr:hypothetical protein [Colocasia esculenta]